MANIDLQSLISQLSLNTGGQSGVKTPGQTSAAGQLFGSILGQQQTLQSGDVASGKALPGGNGLPVSDADALPGVTPEMVKVAQVLAQLAENPQVAGSLSVQGLQNQFKQLLQAEDGAASEASLDDLSALTNLLLAADSTSAAPAANVANRFNVDQHAAPDLNDEQLLQTAATMGVEPAVAATVLQATQTVEPALISAPNFSTAATPLTAAQALTNSNQPVAQINPQSNVQTAMPTAAPSAETVVKPSLSQGSVAVSTNNPAPAATTSAQQLNPTVNNPTAAMQAQPAAQHITDDVVIQVRQAAQQATQQGQPAQVASSVSAQEFFQQRVGRNASVNQVTSHSTQTVVEPGVISLTDNLISRLDQVNNPTPTTTAETNTQAAGQLIGASFKTMAQFNQTSSFAGSTTAPVTAEVPVTEGGSRLQTLMQGDTAAQQAARNMQNQLGQQLQRMVRDGQWQANINLNPARLGQIRINMTMEDGVLTTQLLSANQGVRELLEGGMPRLRELLEESGLQLGQFDVGSDAGNQQQFAHQQEDSGVVTQVAAADDLNTAAAEATKSQHDGDLDTFA